MAKTLESLKIGTPVFAGSTRVGEVRGLYTEGDSRAVEYVEVAWGPKGVDVLLPAVEIENVDDRGVELMHVDPHFYDDLPEYVESRFPTVRKFA